MNSRHILMSGLVFMLLAVALGAFGAHALKDFMTFAQQQIWKTASTYHFYHALGLIGLGIWSERQKPATASSIAGILFSLGIVLFSGSLYALALSAERWLGMITPIGGLLFLAGWVSWMISAMRRQ